MPKSHEKTAIILANGAFGTLEGKTANCLVTYGKRYRIVAVIDDKRVGRDAGEVLGIGRKDIPIVKDLSQALKYKPEVLIIGIAPPGGDLPEEWKSIIKSAVRHRLDIVSGLHYFFGDQPEFMKLAKRHRTRLVDVRKPPKGLQILTGKSRAIKQPVVAVLSTDAASGKNVAMVALENEAKKRGYDSGFVATGQTTIMMGCDAGAAIDAIPGDFMSGQTEKMTLAVASTHKDIILVEGQASLSHPTYGQESLSILYGAWPDAVILVHDPFREERDGFPQFTVPQPKEEILMIETVCPKTKVVGIAVNGDLKPTSEVVEAMRRIEDETHLPTTDVVRFGAEKLFDALIDRFESVGKPLRKVASV
jgi:uncharacterized NAD-dependent epimerase/dehydratase family protein